MSFGYPQFLWAWVLLAVPIIIHLFNFRKTIRVYFSNTKFLKQVKEETTQKRKLKQWLILASRLLFVFFLVLAFALPFLPAKENSAGLRTVTLYVDNSFSMSAAVTEKNRALDQAIRMAQEIVDLFPTNTQYNLLTNDFAPFSNTPKTKTETADLLAQVRLSPVSRTADEIVHRAARNPSTLFWISDFQKSTFGEPKKIDSLTSVHLLPIPTEQNPNVFVDTVFLQNPFAIGGEKNSVTVRLQNQSKKKKEGLTVKMNINGVQAATSTIDIEAESTADIAFDLIGLKGNNKVVVSFNDYPVSFDNEFYFALSYSKKINVLEIKPGTTATYIEKVFGNKELFTFRSVTTSNLNYSLLGQADLVVINGVSRLDEPLIESIQLNKNSGGSVLLLPGADPDIASYQKIISLPLAKVSVHEPEELDKPDFHNPFFANIFEEKSAAMAMPKASRVIEWGADRSAILHFKNGYPFLARQGKYFILSCPLEKTTTDFFSNALFVPVMYRLATHGKKNDLPLYYTLSQSEIIFPADSLPPETPVQWKGAEEFIPSQRKTNGLLIFDLPKDAVTAGFYWAVSQPDTLGLLAFNPDKRESLLASLNMDLVQQKLGSKNISVFEAGTAESFTKELKERYLGTPLWKYAVVLSLLFLLIEILFIRFLK
ncbi:MAG: BatA and WFA domain-containing protein [Bacteroidetes bacterium]|nr:BatA and WFA domain-containing protein [Bacteroidota bacterium]MBS1540933.1 BatA and WFA domain-containing protein [Bacteroidota bacterium]